MPPIIIDCDAKQENDWGRTTLFSTCAILGRARRHLSQTGSEAGRKTSQSAWKAP